MTSKCLHVYDSLAVKGGAESVSLQLFNNISDLDLCVGAVNESIFNGVSSDRKGNFIALSNYTNISGWQTLKLSHYFQNKTQFFSTYESVLYSGTSAPLAVVNQTSGRKIYYCHTPPRFVYDLKDYYKNTIPIWQRPLLNILIRYMKPRYERALSHMDVIIANSKNVQHRLKHHLGVDSIVIYPPCDTRDLAWSSQNDYYLSTARLEPYKRVDEVVRAFKAMPDKRLVVASSGSQLSYLRKLANNASNISFTGWCSEAKMKDLISNCIATVYVPLDEDFGMSPVESMSAGKPVIGANSGGVKETVIHNETGLLCEEPLTVDSICAAVKLITPNKALRMKTACEATSKKFQPAIFFEKIKDIMEA